MIKQETVLNEVQKYSVVQEDVLLTDSIKILGIDSIRLVELILSLQQKLNINIDETRLVDVKTVSDILDLVNNSN